jgi:hypothetical protein
MLSANTKRRLDVGLASPSAADELEAMLAGSLVRNIYFVDSYSGSDSGYDGKSWRTPFATVEKAFTVVDDNDTIVVTGVIAEQITAPQDVFGVRIIGANGGRPRHGTDSGAVVPGLAAHWKEEATATNAPLLTLREQGWEIHNIVMVPESGYSCVKLHRTEQAAAMDASHAVFSGVRFVSSGQVGYGIEDYGGAFNVRVEGCIFQALEYGIVQTNASIANFNGNEIVGNIFWGTKNDISVNGANNLIKGNLFKTAYHASTHPLTVDLVKTADSSVPNFVLENTFADAAADATTAKGYKEATGDIWRNFVTDTAAFIVTVPS